MATEPVTDRATTTRDAFVDLVRAGAIVVVVIWHWVFTVLVWRPDGPHASNPIGTTTGLWAATWVLQVMPLFFFVGGYAHLKAYRSHRARGLSPLSFVGGRVARLVVPTAVLGVVAVGAGWLAVALGQPSDAVRGTVVLILSPLWFLGVYLVLVVLVPLAVAAHDRWGELCLVVLAGVAGLVDVARFAHDVSWVALVNMLVVWGLCHQFGFHYERLVAAPRRVGWTLMWAGGLALAALTNFGLYPRSMVGVPGERISNMGPPTLCIVGLVLVQVGAALLIRDRVLELLDRPRVAAAKDWIGRNAMAVFLWHTTGYAIAYAIVYQLGFRVPAETDWAWWAQRPLWLVLPALVTVPLLTVVGRLIRVRIA